MRNVSWAANQHFRMISEGSCDPEDKSSNAENSTFIMWINYIKIYTEIENYYKL